MGTLVPSENDARNLGEQAIRRALAADADQLLDGPLDSHRAVPLADSRRTLENALDTVLRDQETDHPSQTGNPFCLAFSGGADSLLLATAFSRCGFAPSLMVLTTRADGSDAVRASEAAHRLGRPLDVELVSEEDILTTISENRALLARLPDYTQRILTVCERLLADRARAHGDIVWTGHGPEAILGGFRRHAAPHPDDGDAMIDRLRLNISRLDAVARAAGMTFILPFLDTRVLHVLAASRRQGMTHADLAPTTPTAAGAKRSLQNGAGIHYLFAKKSRAEGHSTVRGYMEFLIA